jgi:ATP:ADP antiporter, AAA family
VTTSGDDTTKPTALERLLRLNTDVRHGEASLVLVLTLNVFLLLTAYYVLKPVREALILTLPRGAEYKSYMSGAIAVALVFVVPAYAFLVDRLPRLKLVVGVTLFFALHLVLFFLASQVESLRPGLSLLFYLWIGLFNLMVVAQLWSFANDIYSPDQGKRLFPLVAFGGSVGAAVGSQIASWLVEPLGVYRLLLVGAALLGVCAFLYVVAERLTVAMKERGAPARAERSFGAQLSSALDAFTLVFKTRYLLAIALFTLVYNWVNSNGEYMLSKLVKEAAAEAIAAGTLTPSAVGSFIGRAYGDFYRNVNVLGVLMQAFLVSRVVKYGGLGVALLVMPLFSLTSGLAVLVWPLLLTIRIGKTFENATDYSLNNTVRQMLWLPTTPAMKYKAKQTVDTLFVRLGDVSSSLLVVVGAELLGWSVRGFAVANVLLVGLWLAFIMLILREGKKLERAAAAPEPIGTPPRDLPLGHNAASET